MLGNLTEWCQESYRAEYVSHPTGMVRSVHERQMHDKVPEGHWNVYRGGSFFHFARQTRSASRHPTPYSAHPFTGFRIARTIKDRGVRNP